ncbi:MAG TPA: serine/threonine-protein kinase [Vicinamibacterales bacterium]|nr:serine/threonine-protein kinase [Vicinamibacterales bacterium]
MTCPSCHASVPESARFCPSCGATLDVSNAETRLGDDHTRLASPPATSPGGPRSGASTSGWLSSSGSIDHGRFAPGAVLDGRYRIIGLLGRGGMGEVYRADDLRLGQAVALKFLPKGLSEDARRLAQFHNEVRTARQVSHPNVCRVYDIGEIEGDLYLSMEYVDGEDLAASLKRIGRFPEDKALDLARQLSAGLAAAHERGVIHRDLKPANIMLDAAGKVRIMDFGLAAIGDVGDIRVGTPAYMAPEQLEGREVTAKSDIYALGIVLYEIFTGRRVYTAGTLAELLQQQSGPVTSPTELVKGLDPAIERAIQRCIDRDPAKRPASALAVSAALPGGDPLAAALAAGETPSPEMVAAAGGDDVVLSRAGGLAWLAAIAVLMAVALALASRLSMFNRTPIDKPPEVLADRAEQIRQSLGYTDAAVDHAFGFSYASGYLNWAKKNGAGADHWRVLASGRPAPLYFWRRTSPRVLVPLNPNDAPDRGDPPFVVSGMTLVDLDATGRLLRFVAEPPEVEPASNGSPAAVDWSAAIAAAGFDPAALHEAAPERTPGSYADERRAWEGTFPGTDTKVRLEAAAYRGRIVHFAVNGPWSVPTRDVAFDVPDNRNSPGQVILILALLVVAFVLARRNLRSGRADTRGAKRLAIFTIALMMAIWLVNAHVSSLPEEWYRFVTGTAIALFLGGVLYLVYLAIEPFLRRSWPTMLVGWTRLLSGRVRDAVVGRDVMIGVAFGVALALVDLGTHLVPTIGGFPEPVPTQPQTTTLLGIRNLVLTLLGCASNGLQNGLLSVLQLALVRELMLRLIRPLNVKRADLLAFALAAVALTIFNQINTGAGWWVTGIYNGLSTSLVLIALLRIGLLASTIMFTANVIIERMPLTLDSTKFYAAPGWAALALLAGVAAVGYSLATRQRTTAGGRIPARI